VTVPYTETRKATRQVAKPVTEELTREYTVMVPSTETRTATRTVSKVVPVQMSRQVCVDQGSWVTVADPCNPCCCRRQWCPKMVTIDCPYTCYKTECEQDPYEYQATGCTPEERTNTVNVCKMVCEPQ